MARIVLEEQKGLWIEAQLLQQAGLGKHLRVVVKPGEIQILPLATVSDSLPYDVTHDEAQAVLKETREEIIAVYGGQPPPADQPYFGGLTWQEYQSLPDEERQAIWDRLYADFDIEIKDVKEHDVRPDALVAG